MSPIRDEVKSAGSVARDPAGTKRGKKNEKVLNRRTIEQGTEEQGTLKA
jgi:hypothetical protein